MNAVLSSRVRAVQRALSDASMPEVLTVVRDGAYVPDGTGGGTYGAATEFAIQCRAAPLGNSTAEQQVAGRIELPLSLVIAVPQGSSLRGSDTVRFRSNAWEVVASLPAASDAIHDEWVIAR